MTLSKLRSSVMMRASIRVAVPMSSEIGYVHSSAARIVPNMVSLEITDEPETADQF